MSKPFFFFFFHLIIFTLHLRMSTLMALCTWDCFLSQLSTPLQISPTPTYLCCPAVTIPLHFFSPRLPNYSLHSVIAEICCYRSLKWKLEVKAIDGVYRNVYKSEYSCISVETLDGIRVWLDFEFRAFFLQLLSSGSRECLATLIFSEFYWGKVQVGQVTPLFAISQEEELFCSFSVVLL